MFSIDCKHNKKVDNGYARLYTPKVQHSKVLEKRPSQRQIEQRRSVEQKYRSLNTMSNYEVDIQGNKQYIRSPPEKRRNINGIYYNNSNRGEKVRPSSGVNVNINSKVDNRPGTANTRGSSQKKYAK